MTFSLQIILQNMQSVGGFAPVCFLTDRTDTVLYSFYKNVHIKNNAFRYAFYQTPWGKIKISTRDLSCTYLNEKRYCYRLGYINYWKLSAGHNYRSVECRVIIGAFISLSSPLSVFSDENKASLQRSFVHMFLLAI